MTGRCGSPMPTRPTRATRACTGAHPDYGGDVDHAALIDRLAAYDGWALSTSAEALPSVLALCPPGRSRRRLAPWRASRPEPLAAARLGTGHLLRRPPAQPSRQATHGGWIPSCAASPP